MPPSIIAPRVLDQSSCLIWLPDFQHEEYFASDWPGFLETCRCHWVSREFSILDRPLLVWGQAVTLTRSISPSVKEAAKAQLFFFFFALNTGNEKWIIWRAGRGGGWGGRRGTDKPAWVCNVCMERWVNFAKCLLSFFLGCCLNPNNNTWWLHGLERNYVDVTFNFV